MTLWEVVHTFKEGWKGRAVRWYKRAYEDVKNGINHSGPHPEVETHIHVVRQSIEAPDEVRQDRGSTKKHCYYTWFIGDKTISPVYMKAVLGKNYFGKLVVITAYFTTSMSQSEQSIWTKT